MGIHRSNTVQRSKLSRYNVNGKMTLPVQNEALWLKAPVDQYMDLSEISRKSDEKRKSDRCGL